MDWVQAAISGGLGAAAIVVVAVKIVLDSKHKINPNISDDLKGVLSRITDLYELHTKEFTDFKNEFYRRDNESREKNAIHRDTQEKINRTIEEISLNTTITARSIDNLTQKILNERK